MQHRKEKKNMGINKIEPLPTGAVPVCGVHIVAGTKFRLLPNTINNLLGVVKGYYFLHGNLIIVIIIISVFHESGN